jgi:hypothetical protein
MVARHGRDVQASFGEVALAGGDFVRPGAEVRVEYVHLPEPSLSRMPALSLARRPNRDVLASLGCLLRVLEGAAPVLRPRHGRGLAGAGSGFSRGWVRVACRGDPTQAAQVSTDVFGRRKCRTLDRTRTGAHNSVERGEFEIHQGPEQY